MIENFIKRGYKLSNLYVAKLGVTPITDGTDDSLFVLEHNLINLGTSGDNCCAESFNEFLFNVPVASTIGKDPFLHIPESIKELTPFPREYCTPEEIESGIISDIRVYEIYRMINRNRELNRN